jgi:hypothetical protein
MSSEIVGPAHQALKDPAGQGAHKDNVHPARMRVTDHAGGGPRRPLFCKSLGCWYIRL